MSRETPASVRIPLFLLLWLTTGFALGTVCLLGPVRWWASLCRSANLGSGAEKTGVLVIIALLVTVSGAAAASLGRAALRSRAAVVRFGIPAASALAAAGTLALWMHPQSLQATMGSEETAPGSRFTFGPYPTEERMRALRKEGYTAIISLLHPAVVPFEPKLLEDEKAMAASAGIKLIHVPLLPWISENAEGIETIRTIARSGQGRYYVHCYLGRDRVHLVKRLVEQAGAAATLAEGTPARSLDGVARLERGEVLRLGEGRWLTPYPTDEEFMSFILGGEVRQVVSLMDPDDPEQRGRVEDERKLLARYAVPFEVIPLKDDPCDPRAALEAARKIRAMPAPLVVHAFFAAGGGREPAAESVLGSYRSGRPALPPSAFPERLGRGQAELIAPHIAVGPRPAIGEFRDALYRIGIREVLFLGEDGSAESREDRASAERAGLAWRASGTSGSAKPPGRAPGERSGARKVENARAANTAGDRATGAPAPGAPLNAPLTVLSAGGPWYLYGPKLPAIEDEIARAFSSPPAAPGAPPPR